MFSLTGSALDLRLSRRPPQANWHHPMSISWILTSTAV